MCNAPESYNGAQVDHRFDGRSQELSADRYLSRQRLILWWNATYRIGDGTVVKR